MVDERGALRVEQTILRLFRLIDAEDAAGVAGLFAPHGAWHRRDAERVGREAIVEEMKRRPPGRRIEHLISNLIIDRLDGHEASVTFRALAYCDDNPHSDLPSRMTLPIALDAYEAHLIDESGVWLLTHLKGQRVFARSVK